MLLHATLGGLRTALLPRASYGSKQSLLTSAASREAAAASEANLAHATVLSALAAKLSLQMLGAAVNEQCPQAYNETAPCRPHQHD